MAFEEVGVRAVVQNMQGFLGDLDRIEGRARGTFQKMGQSFQRAGQGMQQAGRSLTLGVTAPIVGIGGAAVKMAVDFETAFTEVTTLFDLPEKQIDALREGVLDLSSTMGLDAVETTKALYQAISAGVEPAKALQFIEDNARLAVGGVTDLETAVDLTTTVLNAFGLQEEELSRVSDILFTGVRLGKTTVAELGASMFQVAPIAAAAGVGIDQVTAAMATLTLGGTPTSVAATQLRQALAELGKEGTAANKAFTEVAGVGFREFIAQGGTLVDAMGLLRQKAEEDNVAISDLFGSIEAGGAVQVLAGKGAESFASNLGEMGESAGATGEAFDKMNETAGRKFAVMKAKFQRVLIDLGTTLLPALTDFAVAIAPVVEFVAKLVQAFSALPAPLRLGIVAFVALAAALGPVLLIGGVFVSAIGGIIAGVGALSGAIAVVGPALLAASGPLLPFIAAAVILAAIGFLIFKNWDRIAKFFSKDLAKALAGVGKVFVNLGKQIVDAIKKLPAFLKEHWRKIVQGALAVLFPPGAGLFAIITHFGQIRDALARIAGEIRDRVVALFRELVNRVLALVRGLRDLVLALFRELRDRVVGFVTEMARRVVEIFTALPGQVFSIVQGLVSGVVGLFASLSGQVAGILSNLANVIVGIFAALPGRILGALGDLGSLLVERGGQLMGGFRNAIVGSWEAVAEWIRGIPQRILNNIGSLASLLVQIGKDIMGGLLSGLRSGWDAVVDWLGSLGSGPGEAIAKLIASDIPAVHRAGRELMLAFRSGMEMTFPMIRARLRKLGLTLAEDLSVVPLSFFQRQRPRPQPPLRPAVDALAAVRQAFAGLINPTGEGLSPLAAFNRMLGRVGGDLNEALSAMMGRYADFASILPAFDRSLRALGFKLLEDFSVVPLSFQRGGLVRRLTLALVGERGRELAVLPGGTQMLSNPRTEALLAAAPAISISAPISLSFQAVSWAEVRRAVHDEIDEALGRARSESTRAGAPLGSGVG